MFKGPIPSRFRAALACLLMSVGWLACGPAFAERRVALVIGESAYEHGDKLTNPEADASAMAAMFSRLGFATTTSKTNLSLSGMKRALADFELAAKGADIAVIYYSGHGVQVGGQDYLVPTDAALEREIDVPDETVPLDRALQALKGASRLRLLIVDACRTNPFRGASGAKGATRGLAPVGDATVLASTLVAFAASPGEAAVDGPAGGNSPFAAALVKWLPSPGLDVELALRRVTNDVHAATGGQQTPYKAGAMVGQELALVEGPAPGANPGLVGLSDAQICAIGFDAARNDWSGGAAVAGFVDEARRRGLAAAACQQQKQTGPDYAGMSDARICKDALDGAQTGWDQRPEYAGFGTEAKRRGLDLLACRRSVTGQMGVSSDNALASLSDDTLCTSALDTSGTAWDSRSYFVATVAEARRRGYDVEACRRLAGKSVSVLPDPSLAKLSDDMVCNSALDRSGTAWDIRPYFSATVAEARRRGFDVENCRVVLGLPTGNAIAPQPSIWSDLYVCKNGLDSARTGWDERSSNVKYKTEAVRRALDLDRCRTILGLSAAETGGLY